MKIRVLLMGLAFTIFTEAICTPYASIVRWYPGVVASDDILARDAYLMEKQKHMPIWVIISFNQAASPDFVNQFFKYLTFGDAMAHKQNKNQFVITVPHATTQADLQSKLDEANHHFDPNFKTPEEIARYMANRKAENEAKAAAEKERLRIEAEKLQAAEADRRAEVIAEAERLKRAEETRQAEIERLKNEEIAQQEIVKRALPLVCEAISKGSIEEIKQAAQPIISQGKSDQLPIFFALFLKKYNAIKFLLEYGAKVDAKILGYAVGLNDIKIAQLFVKIRPNVLVPECFTGVALGILNNPSAADTDKHVARDLLHDLINLGRCDVNKLWNKVPVTAAIYTFLIKNGANIDTYFGDVYYNTPLTMAIIVGNEQAVKIILDAGADVNKKAKTQTEFGDYNTPLHIALYDKINGREDQREAIVRLLVGHGASL